MSLRSSSPNAEGPKLLRRKSSGFLDAWLSSSQSHNTHSSPDAETCVPSSSPGASGSNSPSSSPCSHASILQPPAKRIKITADNGWKVLERTKKQKVDEKPGEEEMNNAESSTLIKPEKVTVSRKKRAVVVKKVSAKAKLAALPGLPLDILLEIFSHLHPADLLHLSRTTKSLRTLLMRKMTIGVWRTALASVHGLPTCPDDMSHPSYANLMFDSHCHNCHANNVKNISFLLRVRYCTRCVKEKLSSTNNFSDATKSNALIKRTIAFAPMGAHGLPHCSIKEHNDFLREIRSLSEGRAEFAERKAADLKIRKSHAKKCHDWLSKQTSARDKELRKTRRERARAIEQKLIALGFRPELEFLNEFHQWDTYIFPRPNLSEFKDHPSIKQNKPLTERVWTNIEPIMLEYMDEVREQRIENDIESFMQTWMAHLSHAYYKWRTHIRTLEKYPAGTEIPTPSFADFMAFSAIRSIYGKSEIRKEWETLDIASRAPSPARQDTIIKANLQRVQIFLETKMDKEILHWQMDMVRSLYYQFILKQPSFMEGKIFCFGRWGGTDANLLLYKRTMELAIMVFKCTTRAAHSEFEERWADDEGLWLTDHQDYDKYKTALYSTRGERGLLWFPEVLHHPCQGVAWCSWQEKEGDAYPHLMLDPDTPNLRKVPWDVEKLEFDEQASRTVKSLLDACTEAEPTMEWWRVTAVEMDKRDDRFACLKCSFGEKCDGMRAVKVYNWRDAVIHNILAHFGDSGTKFEVLSYEDAENARKMQRTLVDALSRSTPLSASNAQNAINAATAVPNPMPITTPSMFASTTSSPNSVVIPPITQTPGGPRANITTVYGTDKQRLYLPDDQLKLYKCAACLEKPGINYNRRMTRDVLKTHLESNYGCGNHIDFDDVEPVWKWEDESDGEVLEGDEEAEYHVGYAPEDAVPDDDEPIPKWRPVKGIHYYEALDRGSGRPLPIVKMVPGKKVAIAREDEQT